MCLNRIDFFLPRYETIVVIFVVVHQESRELVYVKSNSPLSLFSFKVAKIFQNFKVSYMAGMNRGLLEYLMDKIWNRDIYW